MASKSVSILVPGVMFMIIGFFLFHVFGAALGLILGFSMGEQYYRRHELERQIREHQGEEEDRR
ncbi:hypothetical protein FEJ81_20360 (plasmid) [Natrinema versiforme]|uniref:Uncharacterized protein n=1 Tax=Natrinema versiforme TaxID=88724 RepID=A0A4P8WN88_9EURY|nr:hypothetical protein FEJ81_20360 [Natrinema versiforme]